MPSINSARYAQRIIQTESHESPSFLRKVHRSDPPQIRTVLSKAVSREPTPRYILYTVEEAEYNTKNCKTYFHCGPQKKKKKRKTVINLNKYCTTID